MSQVNKVPELYWAYLMGKPCKYWLLYHGDEVGGSVQLGEDEVQAYRSACRCVRLDLAAPLLARSSSGVRKRHEGARSE